MNQENNIISDVFYKTLKIQHNEPTKVNGGWVSLELDGWLSFANNQSINHAATGSLSDLTLCFLDFLKEKINDGGYGAGCHYELYEERRQEEIEIFLAKLNLTDEESRYFKKKIEYIDNFTSFMSPCNDCENEVSPHESAMSLQMEGEDLCSICLNKRYI